MYLLIGLGGFLVLMIRRRPNNSFIVALAFVSGILLDINNTYSVILNLIIHPHDVLISIFSRWGYSFSNKISIIDMIASIVCLFTIIGACIAMLMINSKRVHKYLI